MLESSKNYRVSFQRKGKQKEWIESVRTRVQLASLAKTCRCSERTIRDWQREKFAMDYSCLSEICKRYGLTLPKVKVIPRSQIAKLAGSKGGKRTVELYGGVQVSKNARKIGWENWWQREGKNKITIIKPKQIIKPRESKSLSEFVGIMIGDGTISDYHIAITLNSVDDKEYSNYVAVLTERLFGVVPKKYIRKSGKIMNIVVARKLLVEYLQSLGLPKGDKLRNNIRIPHWILKNTEYSKACLRGLVDTDGSVFLHTYTSKGRQYSYVKISFTSASKKIREQVLQILLQNNINAGIVGNNVRIDKKESVVRYLKEVGSSNPKHLKRAGK